MRRPRGPILLMLVLLLAGAGTALHAAGRLLLILDDMGHPYDRARLERCFALPGEVAFSIIPGTPAAPRTAARCTRQGRDYLAHLPWRPLKDDGRPERLLVGPGDSPDRLAAVLRQTLRELPALAGANNHQGSRACADEAFLSAFAAGWAATGLPFVDSRTAPGTRIPALLGAAGIPVFENQLFLDHEDDPAAIRARLAELETLARGRELTIAIAHPRPNTLALLGPWLAELPAGITLVSAREALARPVAMDWLAQARTTWPGLHLPPPPADTLNLED